MNAIVTMIVAMITSTHYNELTMVCSEVRLQGMDPGFPFYYCINK